MASQRNHPDRDRAQRTVGMLISSLIRYPEVATLNYDSVTQTVRLAFLATRSIPQDERDAIGRNIEEHLAALYHLERVIPTAVEIRWADLDELTSLEVSRDVNTFTPEEAQLLIELVRRQLGKALVLDTPDSGLDDDYFMQEQLIEDTLEDLRQARGKKQLVALRDDGRVIVFSR